MDQSLTLLSAQIQFLDTELALIHIPLHLYSKFVQPILQLLVQAKSSSPATAEDPTPGAGSGRSRRPWAYQHPFVNVSITPVECSLACSRALAEELFRPMLRTLDEASRREVSISAEDFVVIQVDGEGVEAGQRVVELTAPLAMNGISLFFITTYFSDYILVPLRSRQTVISALAERGFVFEENTEAFVNVSSPLLTSSLRRSPLSASGATDGDPFDLHLSALDEHRPPSTPPPSSISELETRTFALLSRHDICPSVDPPIQLLQCAGRRDLSMRIGVDQTNDAAAVMNARLQLGLVRCLIRTPRPRFLSVTLTDSEPASLLLERELLVELEDGLGGADGQLLLGSKEDLLSPITFDLRQLPFESTGIVCGVAGRLVGGLKSRPSTRDGSAADSSNLAVESSPALEMSYLSTARAGTVMVAEPDLGRALDCLSRRPGGAAIPLADGVFGDVPASPAAQTQAVPIRVRIPTDRDG